MINKLKLLYWKWVLVNIRRELYELSELRRESYCRDFADSINDDIEYLQNEEMRAWQRIAQLTKGK